MTNDRRQNRKDEVYCYNMTNDRRQNRKEEKENRSTKILADAEQMNKCEREKKSISNPSFIVYM